MRDQRQQRWGRDRGGHRRRPRRWGLTVLMAVALGAAAPAQAADFVVTTVADSGPDSLRDAIARANLADEPSTITFGVSGRIELESELPPITGTLTIDGTGRSIIIDGKGAVRPFFVDGSLVDAALTVRRLTITNGRATHGGGIRNEGGILHVEHSIVAGNRADMAAAGALTTKASRRCVTAPSLVTVPVWVAPLPTSAPCTSDKHYRGE